MQRSSYHGAKNSTSMMSSSFTFSSKSESERSRTSLANAEVASKIAEMQRAHILTAVSGRGAEEREESEGSTFAFMERGCCWHALIGGTSSIVNA